MANTLSKEEIIQQLKQAAYTLVQFCQEIKDTEFYHQPIEKWSIAQNVTHLSTATRFTITAFKLPKFILRLYSGNPNRSSYSYDELVANYKQKLSQGGKASGRYVAKEVPMPPVSDKIEILNAFSSFVDTLSITIQQKWTDPQLDKYIAPHPLLGKITLRELGYFTIYHTHHHLAIIKERLK